MAAVTEAEFSVIVAEVAQNSWKVRAAVAQGYGVHLTFASKSGRQDVHASLIFDPATGRCTTIVCPHIGAKGAAVLRR